MERELDPARKRLPPPAEAVPEPAPRDDVKVASSLVRCPYCHSDVAPESTAWVACEKCLARHHTACWDEAGRCSTCGATTRLRADARGPVTPVSRKVLALVIGFAVALAMAILLKVLNGPPR